MMRTITQALPIKEFQRTWSGIIMLLDKDLAVTKTDYVANRLRELWITHKYTVLALLFSSFAFVDLMTWPWFLIAVAFSVFKGDWTFSGIRF